MTRVYISATRTDLASECRTIAAYLESMGLTPVDSYSPAGLPVLASCLAEIETCDIYLLVLGHCYGERPSDNHPDRLSYTQLEFRHAAVSTMPLLVLQRGSVPDERSLNIFDRKRPAVTVLSDLQGSACRQEPGPGSPPA